MKKITFLSLLFIKSILFSQDAPDFEDATFDDITPKHQFTITIGLPNGTSNQPFSKMLQGIVHASTYYQFTFQNHIAIGAGFNYTYLKTNPVRMPEPIKGSYNHMAFFGKISYEKFHSMRFGTEYGLKIGAAQNYIFSDTNAVTLGGALIKPAILIEPSVSFILTADEWSSFRAFVSYSYMNTGFAPQDLGVKTNGGYKPENFSKPSQFITFGFGYTYYFKQWK
jgi:hypothetical protein